MHTSTRIVCRIAVTEQLDFFQANVHPSLPLVVLGTLSLFDATLTLTLPETLDQELPETLEEGNEFGREQSFWWIPCVKR